MTYQIMDWDKFFENNRTRELKRMDWVPVPNKHDGDGFTELLDHPHGMAHYGAWHLILQVASKCNPRGVLVRDVHPGTIPQEGAADPGTIPHPPAGGCKEPHTARSLARITHGSETVFLEAIPRLLSIGWLEVCDESRQHPAPRCGKVTTERNGTERNGTERVHVAKPPAAASLKRSEEALMGKLRDVLGEDEIARCGGHWRNDHIRKHPGRVTRAIDDLAQKLKEGMLIENRAAYLEDTLKRFV